MPAEGSGVGFSVTDYNLSCTLGTDEPLRSALLLTAPPSALFPVSPLLLTAFEKSPPQLSRKMKAVRLQSLAASGNLLVNLFCFSTSLLSFFVPVLCCFPSADINTSSAGIW